MLQGLDGARSLAKQQRNVRLDPQDVARLERAVREWNRRFPRFATTEAEFMRNAVRVSLDEMEESIRTGRIKGPAGRPPDDAGDEPDSDT